MENRSKDMSHSWANIEKTYSKSEIAKQQLCTAIWLFLNKVDFASAITLAGASGEILHKLLEFSGKQSFFEYGRTLFQKLFRHDAHSKSKYINHFRNQTGIHPLRHKKKNDPDELVIDLEDAAEKAVWAAVLDYIKLYGEKDPAIKSFLNYLWLKDGQKIMKDYEALPKEFKKNARPKDI